MPFPAPKKSGIHRRACLALYRALLQQLSRVATTPVLGRHVKTSQGLRALPNFVFPETPHQEEFRNGAQILITLAQRQFRDCAGLQSHHQIIDALNQGYEALRLLRSIPKPLECHSLSKLVAELKQVYPEHPPPTKGTPVAWNPPGFTPSDKSNSGPRVWPHPFSPSNRPHILARPLPRSALTGKRHVPHFVVSNGMPFLRIKKPQPAYLSRVIRDRLEKQQQRVDLVIDLRTWWGPLGEAEDAWDDEMRRLCKEEGGGAWKSFTRDMAIEESSPKPHVTFEQNTKMMWDNSLRIRAIEKHRNQAWAGKLWKILLEERELKFQEEGVLVPLMGPNPERKHIMAQQRRERKQKIKERLQEEVARRENASSSTSTPSTSSEQQTTGEKPFSVSLEH